MIKMGPQYDLSNDWFGAQGTLENLGDDAPGGQVF